jgi:hypothetical protein
VNGDEARRLGEFKAVIERANGGGAALASLRARIDRAVSAAEATPERRRLRALLAALDGDLGSLVTAFADLKGQPALELALDALAYEEAVAEAAAAFDRRRRVSQARDWASALAEALLTLLAAEQERAESRNLALLARGIDPEDSAERRLLRSLTPAESLLVARVAASPRGWAGSSSEYWRLQALQRRLQRQRALGSAPS